MQIATTTRPRYNAAQSIWNFTMTALKSFSFILCIVLLSTAASAHDYWAGKVHINHPWAVATPNGAKVGAGYMKLTNEGTQPDRLIGLSSPIAAKAAIHETVKEGDVVKMRALEKGLEIKPGETIELKPDGLHVMFEGLREPFLEAGRVQGTLIFEKGGSVAVDYSVVPMGTKDPHAKNHAH